MKSKKILYAVIGMLLLAGCGAKTEGVPEEPAVKSEVVQKAEEIDEEEPVPSKAEIILGEMSLEEKVGQMFFARFYQGSAIEEIENYHTGGYIFFDQDFADSDPESFRTMIDECQNASDIPILTGVDEEGGWVVRVSEYPQFRESAFKSPQALYAEGGIERIAEDAKEKSAFLKELGINVNLAPVVDVSTDSSNYIYDRTLGKDAQETAEYAVAVTKAMNESGMGSVLKHFPGYGANLDTHEGKSIDSRSIEYLGENDLVPFAEAVKNGAKAILVSHNVVEAFDKENPATLSPAVHKFIRTGLKFDGVIMTDDLEMGAMGEYSVEEVVVMAVKAGNDMIITSDLAVHHGAVVEAVRNGEIDEKTIDASVEKILNWKIELGIIE